MELTKRLCIGLRSTLVIGSGSLLALSACSGTDDSSGSVDVAPMPGQPPVASVPGLVTPPSTGVVVPPGTPSTGVVVPPGTPSTGVVVPPGTPTPPGVVVPPGTPTPPAVAPPAPVAVPVMPVSGTQTKLRRLTTAEYNNSLGVLLGPGTTATELPDDLSVGGFTAIGAARTSVNSGSAEDYEDAAMRLTEQFFADDARWRAHVGCDPTPALDGACTADYVNRFGRLAFRHALTPEESKVWTDLAAALAAASADVAEALQITTASMLQSPYFLYRIETATGDGVATRFAYDAYSTATRLAFLLTGATPTDDLLSLAEEGDLDTPAGVRAAAEQLLTDPSNSAHLAEFFFEAADFGHIEVVEKAAEFPLPNNIRQLMMQEARLWLQNVVLAADGDAMSFFDSPVTYLNDELGAFYGVNVMGEEFQEFTFPPESDRAGMFGKGAFLASHAAAEISNPTRRGIFVMERLACQTPPPPPPGELNVELQDMDGVTTRTRFELHQADPVCAGCHFLMDNYGFALENFDPLGRFRTEENGLPVTAATDILGQPVSGAAEMGNVFANSPEARSCMVSRFYRYANAESSKNTDKELLVAVAKKYEAGAFTWNAFITDFVTGDAFLTAPTDPRSADDVTADE